MQETLDPPLTLPETTVINAPVKQPSINDDTQWFTCTVDRVVADRAHVTAVLPSGEKRLRILPIEEINDIYAVEGDTFYAAKLLNGKVTMTMEPPPAITIAGSVSETVDDTRVVMAT